MRQPLFDPAAKKRTVRLALNGDLYAKVMARRIDISRVAEAALAEAPAAQEVGEVRAAIEKDLAAYNAYVAKYGSPAEILRDHLADHDDRD
jgi:post-segregation antitoxin (ccd killing protein)